MKNKKIDKLAFLFLGLFAAGFIFSTASAANPRMALLNNKENSIQGERNREHQDSGQADKNMNANKTVTSGKDNKGKINKDQASAASHRSWVKVFVQNLLSVADREGGIGEQVRVIAQEQNDSKEKVAGEIETVESRSKIKTFFFGTDYKNLGELRSDMVKTANQIERLRRLTEKAENPDNKSRLEAQTQALSREQTKIQKFITDNESRFSLFGWAVKLLQ